MNRLEGFFPMFVWSDFHVKAKGITEIDFFPFKVEEVDVCNSAK